MNVLVTGGAGYIGSHAVRALTAAGHFPVVLDDLSFGHREVIPEGMPFELCGLSETERITGILRSYKINAVMHFAAFISVGESVKKPLMYYRNNTAGAMSLLQAMENAGVKRFIFSSTAATYGEPEEIPIHETTEQKPVNPYGHSKWFVEQILKDIAAADPHFAFIAFRYFNVAGASQDCSTGENHNPETHLIPLALFAAMGKNSDIKVYGTDYDTADGTCIRDYVHVEDLVAAHILALESLNDSTESGNAKFYNLSNNRGYSVKEIIAAAEKITGKKIPIVCEKRRDGDPAILCADSSLVQKELGWKPKYPAAEDSLASAWKWYKTLLSNYF